MAYTLVVILCFYVEEFLLHGCIDHIEKGSPEGCLGISGDPGVMYFILDRDLNQTFILALCSPILAESETLSSKA